MTYNVFGGTLSLTQPINQSTSDITFRHCVLLSLVIACNLVVDVVSLDESHGLVNNSPFINAIVKQALLTPEYVYSLENKTTTGFRKFADSIHIALEDDVYHAAYDGIRLSESQLCCFLSSSLSCFTDVQCDLPDVINC